MWRKLLTWWLRWRVQMARRSADRWSLRALDHWMWAVLHDDAPMLSAHHRTEARKCAMRARELQKRVVDLRGRLRRAENAAGSSDKVTCA